MPLAPLDKINTNTPKGIRAYEHEVEDWWTKKPPGFDALQYALYHQRFPIHPSRPHLEEAGPDNNWAVCEGCGFIKHPAGIHTVAGSAVVSEMELKMRQAYHQVNTPKVVRLRALYSDLRYRPMNLKGISSLIRLAGDVPPCVEGGDAAKIAQRQRLLWSPAWNSASVPSSSTTPAVPSSSTTTSAAPISSRVPAAPSSSTTPAAPIGSTTSASFSPTPTALATSSPTSLRTLEPPPSFPIRSEDRERELQRAEERERAYEKRVQTLESEVKEAGGRERTLRDEAEQSRKASGDLERALRDEAERARKAWEVREQELRNELAEKNKELAGKDIVHARLEARIEAARHSGDPCLSRASILQILAVWDQGGGPDGDLGDVEIDLHGFVLPPSNNSDLPLRWPDLPHGREQLERRIQALLSKPLTPQAILDITRCTQKLSEPVWSRRWIRFIDPRVRHEGLEDNVAAVRLARAIIDLAVSLIGDDDDADDDDKA
ncbi:hypothetical protein FFLO_07001 [Filobasidium floriforme]|uniref:Uncharacterized protein n=1 Tax=Filobasidium floriforme TaxID=5210 RepID=A0A8K0JF60_9TREE|nr:uncharacterized protein HD553DRAFT_37413 [Filobasidium floriforme]KAG7527373.1 hypothetical protein FFLO_07001 [Filobasidium floriforme]KAH8084855.1 hypothetical protein HD553DRAFT_37413 [Filobasidium floriforme]